ncbi:GNAT family N-acetyltransferase [Vallitalea okinawensis]|uniref:GNAT family N-acetyltransferase n=1 Tax=Vallitalea okinawensis TaxID=2078660 RepID=UPI000CFC79D4|nr:GNAT family N-acetyltransferase [Vallitalea okinawensis]
MEIRYAKEEDRRAIQSLWEYCFKDSESFNTYYFKQVFAPENTLLCLEDDQLKTALQLNPHDLFIGDHVYKSSYVVGVSSRPEARGKGYMKALMQKSLEEMYHKGEIFSILMPIDSRIYEPYGYAYISDHLKYKVNLSSINRVKLSTELVPIQEQHLYELTRFYNLQMQNKGIWVHRNEKLFNRILDEVASEGGYCYACEQGGRITGFLFYYLAEDQLEVREMLYDDKRTLETFMNLFLMHQTQVKRIKVNEASDGRLKYLLPQDGINIMHLAPFMMGRIINFKRFIEALDFSTNEDAEIRISVIDEHIKENNKVYGIKYGPNRVKVEENQQKPHVTLSISSLTGLLTGYLTYDEVVFLDGLTYNKKAKQFFNILSNQTNYINEFV